MLQILFVVFGGITEDDVFLRFTVILFAWVHLCAFAYSLCVSSVNAV